MENSETDNANGGQQDAVVPDTPTLPWDKFHNWLHCICVVNFDLELGQALERVYPSHESLLSEDEKSNICYLAFPDSNSGLMGDTRFHFKILCSSGICQTLPTIASSACLSSSNTNSPTSTSNPSRKRSLPPFASTYNRHCPPPLQVEKDHFYGYAYFRQVRDRTLRRGYFQKSVVFVSRLPFLRLFSRCLEIVAPEFFENGDLALESACHDIDQWPRPHPGDILQLPLMGNVLQVRIPTRGDPIAGIGNGGATSLDLMKLTPPPSPTSRFGSGVEKLLSIHGPQEPYRLLLPILCHVHLLWELVMTTEPIVVMANSPEVCSEMVHTLISLIWPSKYCGEVRPYFTIHNSEFKRISCNSQPPPPFILGVTNPFFAKTLQHWPHIIRIGETTFSASASALPSASQSLPSVPGALKPDKRTKKKRLPSSLDNKPGLYTQYKAFIGKDKVFLKQLVRGLQPSGNRPVSVQSAFLRRHLANLTQSFLQPLEAYMSTLVPKNFAPFKAPPSVSPFNPDNFIAMLEFNGPHLSTGVQGDWAGLYRKFFRSRNFAAWFDEKYSELQQTVDTAHLTALAEADVAGWSKSKGEVEKVDLFLRLRQRLDDVAREKIPVDPETMRQLRLKLEEVYSSLPDDLRPSVKVS